MGDSDITPAPLDPGPDVSVTCTPPPLLILSEIPDNPSLDDNDPETVAIFEVDGHKLIGKHVTDTSAAESALKLWQEVTLRIPENQLRDLVQFEISTDNDPVAYFNRTGNITTERYGLKIGFSTKVFSQNDPDPCAPLVPRRGSFDWSLIHEFGHLRGWLDLTWPEFLTTFPDVQGPGEGYPEDGSPTLDGDFVTSYAERDDGDEDYAESFTTFIMLPDSAIPAEQPGEPLALAKVRWISKLPGMRELREALRISEADAVAADVAPLPRLADVHPGTPGKPPSVLAVPSFLQGTWSSGATDGPMVVATADDIVTSILVDGIESDRISLKELLAADEIRHWLDQEVGNPVEGYAYKATLRSGRKLQETFQLQADGQLLFVAVERGEGLLDKVE